jgi:apolipoprotein D and lipocalin family protein
MLESMRSLVFGPLFAVIGTVLLAAGPSSDVQSGGRAQAPAALRVVEGLDLKKYSGRWYEVARLPNKFQAKCASDVVANYALREDGRVDVLNRCRSSEGKVVDAHGIARKAGDGKNSARLEVRFAPAIFSFLPVWGDYWVIGLGPDYTWAVVGVPSREYLWILSRGPAMSATSYERALDIASSYRFDVGRLVKTPQTAR